MPCSECGPRTECDAYYCPGRTVISTPEQIEALKRALSMTEPTPALVALMQLHSKE